MVSLEYLPKQVCRELPRWRAILEDREAGASIPGLMAKYDVTDKQVYALLAKARAARTKGWF